MKKVFLALLFTVIFCLSVSAQKISRPTLTPSEPTPAQDQLINQGISLRREKRFDEAVEKYKQVLVENKDCAIAMYELAFAYYNNKKLDEALQVALIGSKYKSKLLPLFYQTIANISDDQGNYLNAIEIYKDAIKILTDDKGTDSQLSSVYFNLGITYARQKMYSEAREVLKKSIEYDYLYASPNYIIAVIFEMTKYKVPALLAAGRFITLENNTPRSKAAAQIITKALNGNIEKGDKPNSVTIFVTTDAPTDEGDFGAWELFLGMSKAALDTDEKNKGNTEEDKFVGQMESFINLFLRLADKQLKNTFVGKNYLPFYADLKSNGHIEAFSYLIMQETANPKAEKWIVNNNKKVFDFLDWAKKYQIN